MKKTTFFSNEDLDNILRGMEGLTTDEKEAYLDARLKELESLPDSRKKSCKRLLVQECNQPSNWHRTLVS